MNNGIIIITGILALFCFGTFSLIMDFVYNKITNEVYVSTKKSNKIEPVYDNEDLTIKEDTTESNIFSEE